MRSESKPGVESVQRRDLLSDGDWRRTSSRQEIREVDGKAGEHGHGKPKGKCPMQEVLGEDAEDRQNP